MAFVNTRDAIGDQATVDGLVSHSLTELKEDGIGIIESYACAYNDGLQSVEFPNVTRIKDSAFRNCMALETLKLGGENSSGALTIENSAFTSCSNLKHFVINRPTKATLSNINALNNTPINMQEGAIYVPENLVSTYKEDSVWKNYVITKLNNYPLSVFDTIEDNWATIFVNGNYIIDYSVKDSKTLELTDGTKIKMDLAALDTDVKSDNSGTAKMTWICHGIPYKHRMNATNTSDGGWVDSEMRSYLISDILSKIPTEIKSHIVSVKKSYRSKLPNDETLWSDDEIWIPSYKEVGFTNASYIESDGVVYSNLFTSSESRQKRDISGSTMHWWLRSAGSTSIFRCVRTSGADYNNSANNEYGVVFGFCTD